MGSSRLRSGGVIATVALVVCACTGGSNGPTTGGSDGVRRSKPQEVRIVAEDFAYTEAPLQIVAGVIDLTFVNRGSFGHEATLSGIGDTPIQEFVDDLGGHTGLEGFRAPDYLDQVAVPPFVSVGGGETDHATFTLSPGRYALWCSIMDVPKGQEPTPHYQLGMMRAITVVAGDAEAQLPQADGSITARDYAFDVDIDAGDRTVTFLNEGPDQVHHATVEVFPEGVSAEEAERAVEADLEHGPWPRGIPSPSGLGFSGIFSDGLGATFRLEEGVCEDRSCEFESGRTYLFRCFVPDREGGKGHYEAHGMYEIVTIE